MKDVMKTIVVFIIVFSPFGIFLWAMFKPFQGNQQTGNYKVANDSSTSERLFHTLFWRILNAEDEGPVSITKNTTGKNGSEEWVSYEFSHTVTMLMWGAYQITIAIVMVNLLIAMMCNTFSEVWKNADKNWKYSRTYYQVLMEISFSSVLSPFLLSRPSSCLTRQHFRHHSSGSSTSVSSCSTTRAA